MTTYPKQCAHCGQSLPYASWRDELLDRAPGIVAEDGPGSGWWRREFVAVFGREPLPALRLIQGGRP